MLQFQMLLHHNNNSKWVNQMFPNNNRFNHLNFCNSNNNNSKAKIMLPLRSLYLPKEEVQHLL